MAEREGLLASARSCRTVSSVVRFRSPNPLLGFSSPFLGDKWRKERDSNPRWGSPHAGFQDRCLKPLDHLSILLGFQMWFFENRRALAFAKTPCLSSAKASFRLRDQDRCLKPLDHLSILLGFQQWFFENRRAFGLRQNALFVLG